MKDSDFWFLVAVIFMASNASVFFSFTGMFVALGSGIFYSYKEYIALHGDDKNEN